MKIIKSFIKAVGLLVCIGCVNNSNKVQYLSTDESYLMEFKIEYPQDSLLIYSKYKIDKDYHIDWDLYKNNGEYRCKYVQKNFEPIDVLFMSNKHENYDTLISHTPFPIHVWPMEIKIKKEENGDFSTSVISIIHTDDGQNIKRRMRKIIYDKNYNIKEIQVPYFEVRYITK